MIGIGKVIYDSLIGSEKLKSLVGSNIYPLIAKEGTTFPFIVYQRNNYTPMTTKDLYTGVDQMNVGLVVCTTGYSQGIEIAEEIRNVIGYYHFSDGDYTGTIILNEVEEEYTEDTYVQILSFTVKTKHNSN